MHDERNITAEYYTSRRTRTTEGGYGDVGVFHFCNLVEFLRRICVERVYLLLTLLRSAGLLYCDYYCNHCAIITIIIIIIIIVSLLLRYHITIIIIIITTSLLLIDLRICSRAVFD